MLEHSKFKKLAAGYKKMASGPQSRAVRGRDEDGDGGYGDDDDDDDDDDGSNDPGGRRPGVPSAAPMTISKRYSQANFQTPPWLQAQQKSIFEDQLSDSQGLDDLDFGPLFQDVCSGWLPRASYAKDDGGCANTTSVSTVEDYVGEPSDAMEFGAGRPVAQKQCPVAIKQHRPSGEAAEGTSHQHKPSRGK